MNSDIINARFEKFQRIVTDYYNRMIQEDIARKYNMKIIDVAKATKLANFIHTRKKSEENLRLGESINPIILATDLKFLDKYNFLDIEE